jgi:hypothetical protein
MNQIIEEEDVMKIPFEIETYKGKFMKIKKRDFKILLDPNKYHISS